MNKAMDDRQEMGAAGTDRRPNWRKAMSDNVALALIVYTVLQIFVTVNALKQGVSSLLPYFALIVLVAAIIPACHWLEKRWKDMPDDQAHDIALKSDFRRDQLLLWATAIGLPLLLTALFKGILALFA